MKTVCKLIRILGFVKEGDSAYITMLAYVLRDVKNYV